MKRKTSDNPTHIYVFGCQLPHESRELIREHLRRGREYYNDCIEIEQIRRKKYREVRDRIAADVLAPLEKKVEDLGAEVDSARAELKSLRKATRQHTKHPDLEAKIKALKATKKEARGELKATRKSISKIPELVVEAAVIDAEAQDSSKAAYHKSTTNWGTKLLVGKDVEAARRSSTDPETKRLIPIGRVGVQIQKRQGVLLTTEALFQGEDQFIQLDPLPPNQWDTRSGRRHAYTKGRVRLGSDASKRPIWIDFDVLIHRPLPKGLVKWAWIQVTRVGSKFKYALQLAVESSIFKMGATGKGTAALDVGWKIISEGPHAGGIQVGLVLDSFGAQRSLVLPVEVAQGLRFADSLRGISDKLFDETRDALRDWMHKNPADVPDWMQQRTETIHAWRGHWRLARVAYDWAHGVIDSSRLESIWKDWKRARLAHRAEVSSTESDLFASFAEIRAWLSTYGLTEPEKVAVYLEWWRRKDHHLYQWECQQRRRAQERRQDCYGNWAAELSHTYATILLEKNDFRKASRNAAPEEPASGDFAHRLKNQASPSKFCAALKGVATVIPKVEINECPSCQRPLVDGECPACVSMDQDFARCWTMLRSVGADTQAVQATWQKFLEFRVLSRKLAG